VKRLLVALVVLVSCFWASAASARVTGWIEPSVQVQHGTKALGLVSGGLSWSIPETEDQMGLYGFFWLHDGWAQVYFGPTYTPKWADWLTVGVHIGLEQVPGGPGARLRYAVSTAVNYQKFSYYGVVEFDNLAATGENRDGLMYDLTVKGTVWSVTKATKDGDKTQAALNIGGRGHRAQGVGPYIEMYVPVGYTTVWLNWTPVEPEGWDYWYAQKGGPILNWTRFWAGVALGF